MQLSDKYITTVIENTNVSITENIPTIFPNANDIFDKSVFYTSPENADYEFSVGYTGETPLEIVSTFTIPSSPTTTATYNQYKLKTNEKFNSPKLYFNLASSTGLTSMYYQTGMSEDDKSPRSRNSNVGFFAKFNTKDVRYCPIVTCKTIIDGEFDSTTVRANISEIYDEPDKYLIHEYTSNATYIRGTDNRLKTYGYSPAVTISDGNINGFTNFINFTKSRSFSIQFGGSHTKSGDPAMYFYKMISGKSYEYNVPYVQIPDYNTNWLTRTDIPTDETTEHIIAENDTWVVTGYWDMTYKSSTPYEVRGIKYVIHEYLKGSAYLKLLAHLGVYIWSTQRAIDRFDEIDDDTFIGYMNPDGTTTGELLRGENITKSDTKNKDYNTSNSDYDPNKNPMPNSDSIADMLSNSEAGITGATTYYRMDNVTLSMLMSEINDSDDINIMNHFVCCYNIPKLLDSMTYGTNMHIKMGKTTLNTTADKLITQKTVLLDTISVPVRHGNAFDTLTKYYLYTPFTGVIPLDYKCFGRTLRIELHPSVIDLTATLTVKADGLIIYKQTVAIGSTQAVTVENNAEKQSSIINACAKYAGSAVGLGTGITTGNSLTIIGGTIGTISSTVNVMNAINSSYNHNYGTNTGTTLSLMPNAIYLIEYVIQPDKPDNFSQINGNLCNKTMTLTQGMGFTKLDNPRISTELTAVENSELKQTLENGVIL